MGNDKFEAICREYISTYPSDNFSICVFSRHFSLFLLEVKKEAYWSEIAAVEWASSSTLDAGDAPQIGVAELGTVPAEGWPYIQFTFHPSVYLHRFHYNAPKIAYAMMLEQESIPDMVYSETPTGWLFWRFERRSFFESVTSEQEWMIKVIYEGKTFSELCEGLCQWLPEEEVAMFAAGSLRNWLEKGLFSSISIKESADIPVDAETLTE